MIGSAEYTLLDYPENMDDLLELGVGDPAKIKLEVVK